MKIIKFFLWIYFSAKEHLKLILFLVKFKFKKYKTDPCHINSIVIISSNLIFTWYVMSLVMFVIGFLDIHGTQIVSKTAIRLAMQLWRKASFACTLLKQCPNCIFFFEISFLIIDPDKFCLMPFQRRKSLSENFSNLLAFQIAYYC